MNISRRFIDYPVMTTLVMAAIVIFGVVGYFTLPVSELPNVDFPTIQVSANLAGADLSLANLTGARLYGTARDEWKIDGVKCDYAFWGGTGKTRTPLDRNYRPGEFEMLYRQLPSVEYLFEEGFTPLCAVLMDKVVRTINEQHPDLELSLDSLILRGIPRAIFSVLHKEDCPRALELVTNLYHDQSNWIEDKYTTLKECYQEITARLQ